MIHGTAAQTNLHSYGGKISNLKGRAIKCVMEGYPPVNGVTYSET